MKMQATLVNMLLLQYLRQSSISIKTKNNAVQLCIEYVITIS